MMVAEALECLGGNGYVEESAMPLLFRESPLNSLWEGSGNVNALDVLRALSREPEALNAWLVEVGKARGEDTRLDRAIEAVLEQLADVSDLEAARPPAGRADGRGACRARCSCGTRRPRSRTRSARPGSGRSTAARSAPCRAGSTCARSSTGPRRRPREARRRPAHGVVREQMAVPGLQNSHLLTN